MRLDKIKKYTFICICCFFMSALGIESLEAYATENVTEDGISNVEEDSLTTEDDSSDTEESSSDDASTDEEAEEKSLSGNANLKRFKIAGDEATIEPQFSKDITEYTVTMLQDMKQLVFTAKTGHKKAEIIAMSGFSNLKNGTNKAVLTVKAEDGTTKSYSFTIIKEGKAANEEDTSEREVVEAVDGFIDIEDSDKKVNVSFDEELLPSGCIKVKYVYKEQIIEAAYFENGQMMLLYLTDEAGENGDFYIYYSGTDEFMDFIQIPGADDKFIFPVQFPIGVVIPDGFTDTMLYHGEKSVNAFMVSETFFFGEEDESENGTESETDEANGDEAETDVDVSDTEEGAHAELEEEDPLNPTVDPMDYYLIYAINQDGEEGFYLYDSMEGTYQRYLSLVSESDSVIFDEESYVVYKQQSQKRMVIIGFMIVAIVILLVLVINMYMSIRDLKARAMDDDEDEIDETEDETDDEMYVNDGLQKADTEAGFDEVVDNEEDGVDEADDIEEEDAWKVKDTEEAHTIEDNKITAKGTAENKVQQSDVRKPIMFDLSTPKVDGTLTPKAHREQLDDDFDFEFLNIDDD